MAYDAILVLGGGLRKNGELPEHAKRRLDLALQRQSGEPLVALSAATAHFPAVLDGDGRPLFESTAGARYLIERGIDPRRVFCESTAYDTIGNGYFSRVQIVEPMGWRRLLVITSEFHVARTESIFRWIYSLDAPGRFTLEFAASSNDGLSDAALSARRLHEEASLSVVEELRKRLTSLRAVAGWLFTEHGQYQAVRMPLTRDTARYNQALLESY
jgi:hypothetical protein